MRVRVATDKVMELLEEYKKEYGDLDVPYSFCTVEGVKLGIIVSNIRGGVRKLTVEQKTRLDELGFVWERHMKYSFAKVIELLEEYKKEYGNLLVPAKYSTADGMKLGSIVRNIRIGARKTTAEQKVKLNQLGFVWKVRKRKRSNREANK